MKKALNTVKKYKKSFLAGLGILVIVAFFALRNGNGLVETFTVASTNIEQSVMLSGKVETRDQADLGFAVAGRISRILVKNNQSVYQGQTLAQLEIGDLLADLKIKQAGFKQENTKIESAYRAMLSGDLELVPDKDNYGVDSPTVSGAYTGTPGRYKVRIAWESVNYPDLTLRTFNLEKTTRIINESSATPLGTQGLYVSFPDDLDSYIDTIWFLDIPNKAGASYTENLNAYNEAKDVDDDVGDSVAEAEIQKINAEIRKNTIYAPFTGIVTNIEKEVGENAGVGERVISILGEEKLEVVLQVSELDVSRLELGAAIKISVDALPGEEFNGVLKTVNSRETEIDGVPVYEAFVELETDERIKTGMSANGLIILATKENVLAVPSYAIRRVDDSNFVDVVGEDGSTKEVEITLGLLGSDSMVEVASGLNLGDRIVYTSVVK